MVDPGWAARTPEANDLLLKAGTGVATTLAAMAVYVAEVASNEVAAGMSVANAGALAADFQGVSAVASEVKSTGINTVAQLLVGWLTEKPPVITAAVNAYTMATSTMVPAALCQFNRDNWLMFTHLNEIFWGWFTPAVVETDREYYGQFWPTNSGAGSAYSAALTSLLPALAVPPPITPMGASPEGPAAAATAVAQSTATGATGDAMRATSEAATAGQSMSGVGAESVGQFAQQAFQPAQQGLESVSKAFETLTGMPTKAMEPVMGLAQSFSGMMGGAMGGPQPATAALSDVIKPASASIGLGPTANALGAGGGGGGGGAGLGPGLTSYTRPVSSFTPENGGRPAGLRTAGLLNIAEGRVPATVSGAGGAGMPMAPGGMLARHNGENDAADVARARVVVAGDRTDQQ